MVFRRLLWQVKGRAQRQEVLDIHPAPIPVRRAWVVVGRRGTRTRVVSLAWMVMMSGVIQGRMYVLALLLLLLGMGVMEVMGG